MTDKPPTGKSHQPLSPKTLAVLSLIQGLLPAMTAIVGGLWITFTFIQHQKDTRNQELKQSQATEMQASRKSADESALANKELRYKLYDIYRPMLEKRDADHFEMAQMMGRILSYEVASPEWKSARTKFWELYWGISVINLASLEEKAKDFGEGMEKYKTEQNQETRAALEKAASPLIAELSTFIAKQKIDFIKRILTAPSDEEAIGTGTRM